MNHLNTLSGQLAPYSQESEEALLGSLLVDGEVFHEAAGVVSADDFYLLRHQYIFEALRRVVDDHLPIDYVTVQEALRQMNRMNDIGGPAYLLRLINATPTSSNALVYAEMVRRTAVRRRLLVAADEIKALAMDEELTLDQIVAETDQRYAMARNTAFADDNERWRDVVGSVASEVEWHLENPGTPIGTPSGFRDLDNVLGGFQKSDLVIFAARPGMGKSSLLLSMARNMTGNGVRVGFASLEMNRRQIAQRMISMDSGIPTPNIRLATLNDSQYSRFVKGYGTVGELPFMIDDTPRLTPSRILAKAIRWRGEFGLDVLIVDYLQILSSGGLYRNSDRVQEVGYFAREMKQIARELNVPVICAAQLNREVEKRADKRPQLSDLAQSGDIENEADIVTFIYRDAVYNEATEFPNRADLIIAKHRNGPTGTVMLHFEKSITRFSSAHTQTIDLSAL